MPKYIVQHTTVLHGKAGDTQAAVYAPGEPIDLTEAEASRLGDNVRPAAEKKKDK